MKSEGKDLENILRGNRKAKARLDELSKDPLKQAMKKQQFSGHVFLTFESESKHLAPA